MRIRHLLPICALALGTLSPLTAEETKLISKVDEFGNEVWIENATKTLIPGATAGEKSLRIEVPAKQDEEWQAQTWVRPLAENIDEGDTVTIAFDARAIEPASARISVTVGLGEAPYTQVVKKQLELGQTWQRYEITEVAKQNLSAADGRFGFTFGSQIQTFEISKLTVTKQRK